MPNDPDPQSKPRLNRFQWDDALLLESQFSDEERMVRNSAQAYLMARRSFVH